MSQQFNFEEEIQEFDLAEHFTFLEYRPHPVIRRSVSAPQIGEPTRESQVSDVHMDDDSGGLVRVG